MRLGFQNGNDVNPWWLQQLKKGKNYLQDTITGGITNLLDNTILGRIAAMNDATNRRAWNYNPALQGQIDFMKDQGMYGVMDQSGLNKITSGVLTGKNLQSLFGSNDLMTMYDKELARATGVLENLPEQWSKLAASTDEEDIAAYKKKVAWHRDRVEKIKAEQAAAAASQQQFAADAKAKADAAHRARQQSTPGYGSAPGGEGFDAGTGRTTKSGYSGKTGRKEMMADGGLIDFFRYGGFSG